MIETMPLYDELVGLPEPQRDWRQLSTVVETAAAVEKTLTDPLQEALGVG